MPKKFSETVPIAPNVRWYEAERKYTILCAQLRKVKGTAAGLALMTELIDRLDDMIEMPKTHRIRLNSRQFDSFPIQNHRGEVLPLKTNQNLEIEERWIGILEAKILPDQEQPDPQVTLVYLD